MQGTTRLSRRALFGAAGGAAALTALGPFAGRARAECAAAIPGSVWGVTGSVDRKALSLVDAFSEFSGASFQGQYFSVLSSHAGAAERYRRNQVVAGETWLIVNQIASRDDYGPAYPAPGTYGISVASTDADGTLRTATASLQRFGKSCGQTGKDATSGTITWTIADETAMEATFDLWFGRDHVTGSFHGPRVQLCDPRPATRTCLKG